MVNNMIESFDARRDIAILPSKEEAVKFATEHFIECANKAISLHGYFAVALSGGSTPKAIYQALAREENRDRIDWGKVLLFWSDERCVPPDHPDSNYKMAMDDGLGSLDIPKEHIFRMKGELHPEESAKEYDLLLNEEVPNERFDLIMLGMGEDGHTASLFPKTHALHTTGRYVTANFVPQMDTWRLTFTYDCINSAENIAIYVLGEKKADIVDKVLNGEHNPDTYPIQNVGTEKRHALWIFDKGAASSL